MLSRSRAAASLLQGRVITRSSTGTGAAVAVAVAVAQRCKSNQVPVIKKSVLHASAVMLTGSTAMLLMSLLPTTSCESQEAERFHQCLEYYRDNIEEFRRKWEYSTSQTPTTTGWPRGIPTDDEISMLETDLSYCKKSPSYRNNKRYCKTLQFRIANYYLRQDSKDGQRKGYLLMKELANMGFPDGMCMYGIVLNEGRVVDADPTQACVWWRRAVDEYQHVYSCHELGVAFYTGEGVAENEQTAVHYFTKAAEQGHPGAAYMLGDCLLDGVGVERDRADALVWLILAADLGHRGARSRVLAVLEKKEGDSHGRFTDASRQTLVELINEEQEEDTKWTAEDLKKVPTLERRFTIGGGARNPAVLQRRNTVVAKSRSKNEEQ
jgi:TPR repeat protein